MKEQPDSAATALRVMYFVDSLRVGGKERQICELLKGLASATSTASVVVTMGEEQFYVPEIHKLGVPLFYLIRRFRWDPLIFPRLLKILREFRPHIIYTNSEMAMVYAWPLARCLGIKIINATIRNAFSGNGARWQWHKMMLRLADARVSNSRAGFRSRGLQPDSAGNYVIYNGLDMTRFQARKEVPAGPGFGSFSHVVGMIAEFSDYKDFPTFIRAAQLVLAVRNDVLFVAVGGGKNLDDCKRMVSAEEERIRFTGQREDVEQLIHNMDIGVLCTFTEGISNSLMEFMAAGRPVVATDGGGTSELIVDGKTGFLVPRSQAVDVAEKIMWLIDNSERAREMGTAGRQRLQDSFSLEKLAENSLRMYSEVKGAR
jgi:glycosyltransferase involved in cell wall biosynthesis